MPTTFSLEASPRLPAALSRLPELAENLMYSWERRIRGLFWRLDASLWRDCGNNPKLFLRRVAQERLEAAASDPDFLWEYHGALAASDIYLSQPPSPTLQGLIDPAQDLIAYFSAEYGFHESLPIYSGGLGILAGDHCKAASDLRLPMVAVGIFYREGYFSQQIDGHGQQRALYLRVTADELPVQPAYGTDGAELRIDVPIGERQVQLRLWQVQVGHLRLVLLDSDVEDNAPEDRALTDQLYGGGAELRIRQEVVLGIGGVRALRALRLAPTAWHINEGHAAFSVLERIRERVHQGLEFDAALECVAAGTVFTTHTVVPAGHDRFARELVHEVLGPYLQSFSAGEATEAVFALGGEPGSALFNMTALALRGARAVNGVSRIHGRLASRMERYVWPQIEPEENPMRSITNGVHLPTFMSRLWMQELHDYFPGWSKHLVDPSYWSAIDEIPYHRYVALRQRLKRDLLLDLDRRLQQQHARNATSASTLERLRRHVRHYSSHELVFGFARRFATYKRATLLLRDRARLARLLNDPARPALLIFAGKAHPRDVAGQALIRELYAASMEPDLIGRLLVVEGYDLHFARNLIQGCDVWINNPEYPLEACGTSGMKAGINGVINLSVLDGWWPEAWDGSNGFAITPVDTPRDSAERDAEEARQLFDIAETQIAPLYYGPQGQGWSREWIQLSKNAMKAVIPRFNAQRMLMDYVREAYSPAIQRMRRLAGDDCAKAMELALWKRRVVAGWPSLRLELLAQPRRRLQQGERLRLRVRAHMQDLRPQDVALECQFGRMGAAGFEDRLCVRFGAATVIDGSIVYELDAEPLPGLQDFRIRAYPEHPLLSHPFETGCMLWL